MRDNAARPDQRPDLRFRGLHHQPHGARRRIARLARWLMRRTTPSPGARRMPDDLAEEMVRALSELRTQNSALRPATRRNAERHRSVRRRHQALQGTAHLGRGAHQRSKPRQEIAPSQRVPVWPKPPAPRADAAKSSTTSSRTCTTGTMIICAMRSPGCTTNSVAAAVPAGHHELPLVVGIDESDEIAEHHAVFVTQARSAAGSPRQDPDRRDESQVRSESARPCRAAAPAAHRGRRADPGPRNPPWHTPAAENPCRCAHRECGL